MYTRCPSCSSTFRITAALLQMADGDVRCGSCDTVFNALHQMVDDRGQPAAGPPALQKDAQEPIAADETLEFDAPERDWQRFFITGDEPAAPALRRPEPPLGEDFATGEPAAGTADAPEDDGEANERADSAPARSIEEETADTDTWQAFLRGHETDEGQEDEEAEAPLWVIGADDDRPAAMLVRAPTAADDDAETLREPAPDTPEAPGEGRAAAVTAEEAPDAALDQAFEAAIEGRDVAGPTGAEETPETILDWGPPPAFSQPTPAAPTNAGRWLMAIAVAAMLLAGQALHHFRDRLAASSQYGEWLRTAYARIGQTLYPDWPLDAYEIRGVKAIAENSGPGTLDIVAEIAVTGSQAVGLPMVRVVLRDRWTNPVASGVFAAPEYLAETLPVTRAYAPGTLIPVEISLKDPNAAAQGYEVDVCLPNRRLGLQCKAARDPYRR